MSAQFIPIAKDNRSIPDFYLLLGVNLAKANCVIFYAGDSNFRLRLYEL
jgi:hypothetical protein